MLYGVYAASRRETCHSVKPVARRQGFNQSLQAYCKPKPHLKQDYSTGLLVAHVMDVVALADQVNHLGAKGQRVREAEGAAQNTLHKPC
jgi:hypothetical protein